MTKPAKKRASSEDKRITRCLRVELVKPIDRTWDELGPVLRDQRAVMHRLLNAAVVGCLAEERFRYEPDRVKPTTKSGVEEYEYTYVQQELDSLREWARKQKGDAARFGDLEIAGATLAMIARAGRQAYKDWSAKRNKWQESKRLATWAKGAPIPIHNQQYRLYEDAGRIVLDVQLEAKKPIGNGNGRGRGNTRFAILLRASKGSHWSRLRELARGDGDHKLGALKFVYDDERSKKWFALISYSSPAPAPAPLDPGNALVVHRGQRNALYCISSTGKYRAVRGNKFVATKRRLMARMLDARRISACELGAGAKGHGRERRQELLDVLDGKLQRVTQTTCQQWAAEIVRLAHEWGCGTVVIEDYGGIAPSEDRGERRFLQRFPFAQLKGAIVWACRKHGLVLREVPAAYISSTCPRCGNQDTAQHNDRTGVFHCSVPCGYERDVDHVAGRHMLRLSGCDQSVWEERDKQEKKQTGRDE